jgi:hypothetical protein
MMSPGDARVAPGTGTWAASRFAPPAVLLAAVVTRFLMVGDWSLWWDEERSLYFSQHPTAAFPRHFPLFFLMLRGLFEQTGVSVEAGRMLVAAIGVLSIWLTYEAVRRLVGQEVAVLAAALLVLSLGHLFWSQSIRYYILLFSFQVAGGYFFLSGFERGRLGELVLANVCLFLATLCHLSAALLFPVFAAHLVAAVLLREKGGAYTWKGYLAFGLPFLAVTAFVVIQYLSFATQMPRLIANSGGVSRDVSIGILGRFTAYFGPVVLLLSLGAPLLFRGTVSPRVLRFFLLLGFLPLLEVVATGQLGIAFPLWYQALISLAGIVTLAGITLRGLRLRGYTLLYGLSVGCALAISLPFMYWYYTSMHGDRARWQEAALVLRTSAAPGTTPIAVYSTVPDVMTFYLDSGRFSVQPVTGIPQAHPSAPGDPKVVEWFAVEHSALAPDFVRWLSSECDLMAVFEARSGPKDRTVYVYRRKTG